MSSGLRRFVAPERQRPAGSAQAEPAAVAAPPVERCELCGTPCGPEGTVATPGHNHVVDLEHRAIRCACRPCYLLFTRRGAAAGKYQAVPERFVHHPGVVLSNVQWDELQIPVRIAFLFRNSDEETDEWVAFYPSPAGATQSLLSLESWAQVVEDNPVFASAAPDVEAVLVQRIDNGFEAFVVPITACYELVARVRLHWQGFDGGEKAHEEIATFFDALRKRSAEDT